jgi:N-acyl-D-amino-acid deacylase
MIGHYARDLGLMSVAEMISHLTFRPAKRMDIYPDRGVVAIGSAADLVLFDPKTIVDKATFENPKTVCEGIKMVLVNGVVVCEDGVPTGKRPGKVMRRDRTTGKVQ